VTSPPSTTIRSTAHDCSTRAPSAARPPGAALHDEVRRDDAGDRIEDGAAEGLDRELGHDLARLLRRRHSGLEPGGRLVYKVGLKALDVGGVVKQEEIAVEAQVELLPHLLLEALEPPDRLEAGSVDRVPIRSGRRDSSRRRPRPVVGQVKYLELSQGGKLHAVCEIDGSGLGEGPWHFSPEILHRRGRDIELRALAVTKRPASVGLGPIEAFPGKLYDAARSIIYQDGRVGQLVRRAAEFDSRRKRGEPLQVHGAKAPGASTTPPELASPRPAGQIEYRSAQHVNVDRRHRLIELLAVPYGVEALVPVHGRMIAESFSNVAFADVDKQPGRHPRDPRPRHEATRRQGHLARAVPPGGARRDDPGRGHRARPRDRRARTRGARD
jgi:hypothetical protein